MQPLALTLKGFRGIRDGLGREEITLDLERLTQDAQLIAIVGANGSGKSTIMDCLVPYIGLPSRAGLAGGGRLLLLRSCVPARKREGPDLGA
jgi:exonuclease SbcC